MVSLESDRDRPSLFPFLKVYRRRAQRKDPAEAGPLFHSHPGKSKYGRADVFRAQRVGIPVSSYKSTEEETNAQANLGGITCSTSFGDGGNSGIRGCARRISGQLWGQRKFRRDPIESCGSSRCANSGHRERWENTRDGWNGTRPVSVAFREGFYTHSPAQCDRSLPRSHCPLKWTPPCAARLHQNPRFSTAD